VSAASKLAQEPFPVPGVGEFVSVVYPESGEEVPYEPSESCGRVIERKDRRIKVFFPLEDCAPDSVWLEPLFSSSGRKWKDCSTPAVVELTPASAGDASHTLSRLSEQSWSKLLKDSAEVALSTVGLAPQPYLRATFDLQSIYGCDSCWSDPRQFAQKCFGRTGTDLLKKHPPIGCGRDLFFVNINPRSSKNAPMEWAMASIENFKRFAENRYRDESYIPAWEGFYRLHNEISHAIFPGGSIEDVAVVHELYLCASPSSQGLPRSASPCADKYLRRHLLEISPKMVIAIGRGPAEYFGVSCYGFHASVQVVNGFRVNILALPFPRMWRGEFRREVVKWARDVFMAVSSGGDAPEPEFDWPGRG